MCLRKDKEKALSELFHTVLKKRLNEVYSLPADVDRVRFMDAWWRNIDGNSCARGN
ncbi:MAG: hypothetical protein ACLU4J_02700 [Butyricimonas paravirosa]